MPSTLAQALTQYIDFHGGGEGVITTPIDGLVLLRRGDGLLPSHALYRPSWPCLTVTRGELRRRSIFCATISHARSGWRSWLRRPA